MQHHRIPQHDDQGPVLLGIPAPEAAPRIVRPQPSQHRPHKAEQDGEADNAVHNLPDRLEEPVRPLRRGNLLAVLTRACDSLAHEGETEAAKLGGHIHDGCETREKRGRVAQRDADDVGCQPELSIEHCRELRHGFTVLGKQIGDEERRKAHHPCQDVSNS